MFALQHPIASPPFLFPKGNNMKKLSLEKTQTECLRMWKRIKEQVEAGNKKPIWQLKEEWMEENNYPNVQDDCFFCDYANHYADDNCDFCPGRLIDKTFDCDNKSYSWHDQPIAFYNKLLRLNRKREKAKK